MKAIDEGQQKAYSATFQEQTNPKTVQMIIWLIFTVYKNP